MSDRLGVAREILGVEFGVEAVIVTYFTNPDDLRRTGLQQSHRLIIPVGDHEYDDEVAAALDAVQALLNDALEDVANLPPWDPDSSDEDEDEEEEAP